MIAYRATLDVPTELAQFVAKLLAAERRRRGTPRGITAARAHALPALYRAAAAGLPTLADSGYEGAGIGIRIPVRHSPYGRDLVESTSLCRSA